MQRLGGGFSRLRLSFFPQLAANNIDKTPKPHCFKNINTNQLPVTWRSNTKAWMTSHIFTDLLKDFDQKMRLQQKNVLLFFDNAPSHPSTLRLTNDKLQMLPANCTLILQPLDQGVIQTLKLKYRKRLLRHVLMQLSAGKSRQEIVDSVNVLDACHWINTSMNDIQPSNIIKCFAKCGMKESVDVADPDTDDDDDDDVPLARLMEQLRDHDIPQSLSEQDYMYVNIDADVPVNHSIAPGSENRLKLMTVLWSNREPIQLSAIPGPTLMKSPLRLPS